MQSYCVFDFETYSEADLKKVGAWEYSLHPSTEVLCAAFRIGNKKTLKTNPTQFCTTFNGNGFLFSSLRNQDIKLVAHNAFFEQSIVQNILAKKDPRVADIPISRWICTAAMAASCALPRSLDGACKALDLAHSKDVEGRKIMLKMSKPRKPTKNNPSTRWEDEDMFRKLKLYCRSDVDAEVGLFLRLPELAPRERDFWELDQKMNFTGFSVDRALARGAVLVSEEIAKGLDQEIKTLSGGVLDSSRQVEEVKQYLNKNGCKISSLGAQEVREVLQTPGLDAKARRILEIRQENSRSSVAKYKAFLNRSAFDSRARGNTLFYGAHTGRQSGTGLQPQNLFKRVIPQSEVEEAIKYLRSDNPFIVLDLWSKPADVLASCLRSTIVAKEGHVLDVADFSTIEVRVLFWLCGHKRGLSALKQGQDLYIEMASKIYAIDELGLLKAYKEGCDKSIKKRQLGKAAVLGAGYGIGLNGERFQATAKAQGLDIEIEVAQLAVKTYREYHSAVPKFWANLETAVIRAIKNPKKSFRLGYLTFQMEDDFLTIGLPIGRKLFYYKPEVTTEKTIYGPRPKVSYLGVKSPSKKFERISTFGGSLVENVTQAVARDVLMEALWRVEHSSMSRPILAVHDEIIAERKKEDWDFDAFKLFLDMMSVTPKWARDLPIKVEGWSDVRYRK